MISCYVKGPFHHDGVRVEPGATVSLDVDAYERQRKYGNVVTTAEHEALLAGERAAADATKAARSAAKAAEEKARAEAASAAEAARAEAETEQPRKPRR